MWTVVGLASGLFYREFTKAYEVAGGTQLAVVHTHTLVLGTLTFLLVLVLEKTFLLSQDRRARWFVVTWHVGLALTAAGMLVKGMMQVAGNPFAASPAIAGVSGLGHMVLTAGFVLLFLLLRARIAVADERPAEPLRR